MSKIHRPDAPLGEPFWAAGGPVTFGWQESRQGFSIWHHEGVWSQYQYLVVLTNESFDDDFELIASCVADGHHVAHLLRRKKRGDK